MEQDSPPPELPQLFAAVESGHPAAKDRLFAVLYDELRRIARRELARGAGPLVSLGATTLVHEAYTSLAGRDRLSFPDEPRFMAYVARAMRHLIVDAARDRRAHKRGGEFHFTRFDTAMGDDLPATSDVSRLSEALDALAAEHPALAELVELSYFCGLTFAEIAALRGVAERTVQRDWKKARLLLYTELEAAG